MKGKRIDMYGHQLSIILVQCCSILSVLFQFTRKAILLGWWCHSPFTNDKCEIQRGLDNWPKVTQLESGKSKVWIRPSYFQRQFWSFPEITWLKCPVICPRSQRSQRTSRIWRQHLPTAVWLTASPFKIYGSIICSSYKDAWNADASFLQQKYSILFMQKASSDKAAAYSLSNPGIVINCCLPWKNVFIKPWEHIRVDTKSPFSYLYRNIFPSQQTEGHRAGVGAGEGEAASLKFPIRFRGHSCEPAILFPLLWALRTSVWRPGKRVCFFLAVMHADLHLSRVYKLHPYSKLRETLAGIMNITAAAIYGTTVCQAPCKGLCMNGSPFDLPAILWSR